MSLVLRQVKGSKLTIQEGDNNFTYLEGLANKSRPNVASFFDITDSAVTTFSATSVWTPLISNSQGGANTANFISLVPDAYNTGNFGYIYQIPGVSGNVPAVFKFEVIATIKGGNSKDIQIALFRDVGGQGNPTIWPCSVQDTTTNTPGSRPVQLVSQCLIGLLQGDVVSLFVQNLSDTSSIEIKSLNVIFTRYEL
jgi:hypothetical protein